MFPYPQHLHYQYISIGLQSSPASGCRGRRGKILILSACTIDLKKNQHWKVCDEMQNRDFSKNKSPISVAFHAHRMTTIRKHNLAIQFHAYATFFFSFSIYLWQMMLRISIAVFSSPVFFHAQCILFLIFHFRNSSLNLA